MAPSDVSEGEEELKSWAVWTQYYERAENSCNNKAGLTLDICIQDEGSIHLDR
jgi:hypothetical protein